MKMLPILFQTRNVEGNGVTSRRIQSDRNKTAPENIGSMTTIFLPLIQSGRFTASRVPFQLLLLLLVFLGVSFPLESLFAGKKGKTSQQADPISESFQPLGFVPNAGQWPAEVRFRAEAPGFAVWVTNSGLLYQFSRSADSPTEELIPIDRLSPRKAPAIQSYTVKANFTNASSLKGAAGQQVAPKLVNFFVGSDQSKWISNLPVYGQIVVPNLYSGIDLLLSSKDGALQYDFVVAAGADPSIVEISYDGIQNLSLGGNGEIRMTTPWGEIIEQPPVSFQDDIYRIGSTPVRTSYQLTGAKSFKFNFADGYDRSLPLVIDPIISYSSYVGGSADDGALDIEVLLDNSSVIVGYTASTNFPKLLGLDTSYNGAPNDIFVSKITDPGSNFVFSSYIGGNGDDVASSITSDASGNLYITGYTTSTNFPTVTPIDGTHNGDWDVFVLRLNAAGNSLNFSTYLGGSNKDRGDDIARTVAGDIYIAGFTRSTNFPVTATAVDTSANGGWDALAIKLNSAGTAVTYATYLGGASDDFAYALAADTAGNAFIAGQTSSVTYPIASPYQAANNGGTDGFISKLNSTGTAFVFSTYLGGLQGDWIEGLQLDNTNRIYVGGVTSSADFPIVSAYDNSYNGGGGDGFACRFAATGATLQYSTFVGGSNFDRPTTIVVDDTLRITLVGYTSSIDYPTVAAIDGSPDSTDAFISQLSATGSALVFSTYLGGTAIEYGYGADFSVGEQQLYVCGTTNSINYPDFLQIPSAKGLGYDAFATRIAPFFDTDNDGIPDGSDNCPFVSNVSQANADGDALGDACDLCTDTDGDGFGNPGFPANTCTVDNCPTTSNPTQANADGDALGDACDLCPLDPLNDADGDGICANLDNCPTRFNPLQEDTNFDGVGDSCSNTPVGTNSVVNLPGGITVTFANVTKNGLTEVGVTNSGPAPDASFGIIPISNSEYYNFSTTALYTGNITVCITYDQADVTGAETLLTLRSRHTGPWTNVTSSLNTTSNVICGVVTSLNVMAIATTGCCQGTTGNIDCDPGNNVDILDLTVLVDHLFLTFDPLCCTKEANVDGVGGDIVDLLDLSRLVDHLFISFGPLANCL